MEAHIQGLVERRQTAASDSVLIFYWRAYLICKKEIYRLCDPVKLGMKKLKANIYPKEQVSHVKSIETYLVCDFREVY